MARLIAPFLLIVSLGLLAMLGANSPARNPAFVNCAYALAMQDMPAADVLFIGSSRLGRGLDPAYMMDRIREQTGDTVTLERIALTFPNIPQFRPIISRYLLHRGPPQHVFLQILSNFEPERQRRWDVPVHLPRNIANASLTELVQISADSELNDYQTRLPRRFEAGYQSLPILFFQKAEALIYGALRFPSLFVLGQLKQCGGESLYDQDYPGWLFDDLDDSIAFEESETQRLNREENFLIAAEYLPLAPADSSRHFETDQLRDLISMLQVAGSEVTLILMPALGDTELTDGEIDEIAAVFPGHRLVQPYALFDSAVGPDLARSFIDTHHATPFGALQYSRHFADAISQQRF